MIQPTSPECTAHVVMDTPLGKGHACWYPQMGGYTSHAIAVFIRPCWEIYVWHDGEFPFAQGEDPAEMHHCSAPQFTQFGQLLESWEEA